MAGRCDSTTDSRNQGGQGLQGRLDVVLVHMSERNSDVVAIRTHTPRRTGLAWLR